VDALRFLRRRAGSRGGADEPTPSATGETELSRGLGAPLAVAGIAQARKSSAPEKRRAKMARVAVLTVRLRGDQLGVRVQRQRVGDVLEVLGRDLRFPCEKQL